MATRNQDRVFVRKPWKHYRKSYAVSEAWISLAILCVLGAIATWVMWRGAHPDPELFAYEIELDPGSEWSPDDPANARPPQKSTKTPASQDSGAMPSGLALDGWTQGKTSEFDSNTLYEKINGREGYYKSFGFERLYFVSLVQDDSETTVVDIEMYDQGKVANALGAYAGERQQDAEPQLHGDSISHLSQNALYMVRGRYYIRAIGPDDSEPVIAQLNRVREVLSRDLDGAPLPWAFALFVGQLGVDPGKIAYTPENAFSFGFARNVYAVEIDDEGAEMFTAATESAEAATRLVAQFTAGFSSIGSEAGTSDGVTWIQNEYLHTIAGVTSAGLLVVGVRGAADLETARETLSKLRDIASNVPESLLKQAAAEAAGPPASGDDGGEGSDDTGGEDGDDAGGEDGDDAGGEDGDDVGEKSGDDAGEGGGYNGDGYEGTDPSAQPSEEY